MPTKTRLLCLLQILQKNSDEERGADPETMAVPFFLSTTFYAWVFQYTGIMSILV